MKGFSLIEGLLGLLVLSATLLLVAGMQLSSLKYVQEAYYESLATVRLSEMLERLRANASVGSREREWARWDALNRELLPQGQGEYSCQNTLCMVRIYWMGEVTRMRELSARVGI